MARSKRTERSTALYETILKLKDPEECRRFFRDLCTPTELRAGVQRISVARAMLDNGAGGVMREVLTREGLGQATNQETES